MPTSYSSQKDPIAFAARGIGEPAGDMFLITPQDAADLPIYAKALRIHVPVSAGEATLRLTPALASDDANVATIRFAGPGTYYEPISARRIWATGTSAGVEIHGFSA